MKRVLFLKLVRDMARRRWGLLALVVIAAIGVISYVSMAAVYRDLDDSRAAYYRDYRLADFTVDMKRAPEGVVEEAGAFPNVRAIRGRVSVAASIELDNVREPVAALAISMPAVRRPVINDVLMRSGTWFSGGNEEVIIDDAFARANGLAPGSRIRVLLPDRRHDMLVVGTAISPEFVYLLPPGGGLAPDPEMYSVLYMREDFLQKAADLDGAVNQLIGMAFDASDAAVANTLSYAERALDAYGVTNTTARRYQQSVWFLSEELKGLKVTAAIMPTIFLAVAALVLNVMMTRMVAEQRTVIGVLRAVGYTYRDVMLHYLGFGLVVGAAGGVAGVIVGSVLQSLLGIMYRRFFALPSITAHFYGDIVATGVSVSIIFAVAGCARGAHAAIKMEPADAMRPPAPEIAGRVLFERIGFFWRRLPFRWKMIVRALARNPFRSTVSVLGALVSTALLFATMSNSGAFDYLVNYEYRRTAHEDYTLMLREPIGRAALAEAADLPGTLVAEPQLEVVCDLASGSREKRLAVTGMAPGNHLRTPLDGDGRPVVIPQEGLVLTRKLADILGVAEGSVLKLRPLVGTRVETAAPVVGIVDTYFGLSAYTNISYLSRLIGESWVTNELLLKTSGASVEAFLAATKKLPTLVGLSRRERSLELIDESMGESLGTMISILVFFAGSVAVGSIVNTALVSLSEREREVGSLRVIGYTPGQVLELFTGESFVANAAGTLVGLAAGVGLAKLLSMAYYTDIYRFPLVIYTWQFFVVAGLMAFFFSFAQAFIYRTITKLRWLDVLKSRE